MSLSALGCFDRLVPKDAGSRRIGRGLRFGPLPRHRLDLYAPRRPSGPLPLLVFVHGGGWDSGDRREYGFAGRALAALGFLTAIADYGIVPEIVFPGFVEDLALAANWLVANAAAHGGDAGRLLLAGHSAGAYNAVMLGLDPARFGGIDLSRRLAGVVGLSGPYDFYPYDVKQSIAAFGACDTPLLTQPVNLVTPQAPPMLLAHGTADTTVGDYHTARLAAKLRQAGVAVAERHYRGLGHAPLVLGLARPLRPFLPVYGDVAAWLRGRL